MRFISGSFLVANIAIEVVLEMPFLNLNKVEINFADWEPNWRTYGPDETLPITKRLQMIHWKKFGTITLALENEVFVVHMA